jgi:hypothetical protein
VNIIDKLVLELGIDPKTFSSGAREALDQLRRVEQEGIAGGKRVEGEQRRMFNMLSSFRREALGLTATFLGGRGIKEFVGYVTSLDAATGRLSHTMQMGAEDVSAWQGAIKQVGGSAESANSALQGLSSEMHRFVITGQSQMLPVLSRLGIDLFDQNRQLKTAGQLWLEIADAIKREGMSPSQAASFLGMIPGANQDMINLLIKGRGAVEGYIKAAREAGTTTKESAASAQEYQKSLSLLEQSATDLGRSFVTFVTPALSTAMDAMRRWIQVQNKPAEQGLKEATEDRRTRKGGISVWDRIGSRISGLPVIDPATGERRQYHLGVPGYTVVGGGQAPAEPAAAAPAAIPVKPGAGVASPAVQKILDALAGTPGINRVTAMNDPFHALLGGAHPAGRAVDVTLKDPSQSADMAAKIRGILAAQGIKANVIDEYAKPSANSTGGHIHIGIDPLTAARLGGAALPAGLAPGAAAAALAGASGPAAGRGGVSGAVTVSIGAVNVNAPNATDAAGIAKEIGPALDRTVTAGAANYGAQ